MLQSLCAVGPGSPRTSPASRNLARSASVGTRHVSRRPNQRYRRFAIMRYRPSRAERGINPATLANMSHIPPSNRPMPIAASDSLCTRPFNTSSTLSGNACVTPNLCRIACAAADCRAANRICPASSCPTMNCTERSHNVQTPSKRTMGPSGVGGDVEADIASGSLARLGR
jgi:hypothetical protein